MNLRGAGAVVLGFMLVTLGVAFGTFASDSAAGAGSHLTVGVAGLIVFLVAGWTTARLAPSAPLHHAAVLAAISVFMGVVMMLPGSGPYASAQLLLLLTMLVGIPAGAALGASRRGQTLQ